MVKNKPVMKVDVKLSLRMDKSLKNRQTHEVVLSLPSTLIETISEQLVLPLASKCEPRVGFFGEIEVNFNNDLITQSILDTEAFEDYMESVLFDSGHLIEICNQSNSSELYLVETSDIFEGDDNQHYKDSYAKGVCKLITMSGYQDLYNKLKDKLSQIVTKETKLEQVSDNLNEAVLEISKNTGLSTKMIASLIKV